MKTNYLALLGITIISSLLTMYIVQNISYDTETSAIAPTIKHTMLDDSHVVFNSLVAQGWKIYRDEEKNIEFAYPKDWEITNNDNQNVSLVFSSKDTFQKRLLIDISLLKNGNSENLNINEWFKNNIDLKAQENIIKQEQTIIDSKSALYTQYKDSKSETFYGLEDYLYDIEVDFVREMDVYMISGKVLWTPPSPDLSKADITVAKKYETEFNQILLNFHFIK